jgi:hypothetical protein
MGSDREQAIFIVEIFLEGGFASEDEDDSKLKELHSLVPDPEVERFIFWGPEGPAEARYEDMSAEDIVDEAFTYQSIRL